MIIHHPNKTMFMFNIKDHILSFDHWLDQDGNHLFDTDTLYVSDSQDRALALLKENLIIGFIEFNPISLVDFFILCKIKKIIDIGYSEGAPVL